MTPKHHGTRATLYLLTAGLLTTLHTPENWKDTAIGFLIGSLLALAIDHAHRWSHQYLTPCPTCNGQGQPLCHTCEGTGTIKKTQQNQKH